MNRLAQLKITCSPGRLRGKLDLLGENHSKLLLDAKKQISQEQQIIVEKEAAIEKLFKQCDEPEHTCTDQCTVEKGIAAKDLKKARLNMHAGFAILFDNIDGKVNRRHMTKENQNFDFHWVNHKAVMNRVSGNKLDNSPRNILEVSNIKLLPTVQDQKQQRHNYVVLVARILVEHLQSFALFKEVCVKHIPHKYSKEMAGKSESVSIQ